MQTMMNRRKDFIASHLRSQIEALRMVLESMERENLANSGYIDESLKKVEKNLHRIRRHF